MVKANLGKDGIQVIKGFLELIGAPRSSREVSRQEAEVMILGSELDAHDSVTGKTRELLNKVVKAAHGDWYVGLEQFTAEGEQWNCNKCFK